MHLVCNGHDLKDHDIRSQISRIKKAMVRLNEIKQAKDAPRLDVPAAKRFVRHALSDK